MSKIIFVTAINKLEDYYGRVPSQEVLQATRDVVEKLVESANMAIVGSVK